MSIDLATGYVLDTLREGDDLKLVCDVDSNPPPTRIVWYRKVRGDRVSPSLGNTKHQRTGFERCRIIDWSTMWPTER